MASHRQHVAPKTAAAIAQRKFGSGSSPTGRESFLIQLAEKRRLIRPTAALIHARIDGSAFDGGFTLVRYQASQAPYPVGYIIRAAEGLREGESSYQYRCGRSIMLAAV